MLAKQALRNKRSDLNFPILAAEQRGITENFHYVTVRCYLEQKLSRGKPLVIYLLRGEPRGINPE